MNIIIHNKKWKADNQIRCIPWPSQSPDLNPMENVWAVLKANVSNYRPISVKHSIQVIKKEWKGLDSIFAKKVSNFNETSSISYFV